MKLRHAQRGQVLVIVLGALFLGGGMAAGALSSGSTLKQLGKDIKALELDESREDRALDVLKRWQKSVKPMWKTHSKRTDEVIELLEDQYTTAETIREIFQLQSGDMADAELVVLGYREELRTVLGKDDWERVFAGN
jgi:hypothetical protein